MRPSLAALLAPLGAEVFRERHWQKEHVVVHDDLARFGPEVARIAASSVEELVQAGRGEVQVWFEDREKRYRSISVSPEAALPLHAAGMTAYFDCESAEVRGWLRTIAAELGRDPRSAVASLFASRAGEHVGAHFDRNENFTIQLRGRKRWSIASKPRVEHPASNWVAGMPRPTWLEQAVPEGLPRGVPESATTVDLSAGTMLYVPAGFWHATETLEDSLSLNLNLTGAGTWMDVVQTLVAGLLAADPAARAYATGAWTAEGRPARVHAELDAVLDRLRASLQRTRARDLWGLPSDASAEERRPGLSPSTRLRRNPLGALSVEEVRPEGSAVLVTRHGADEQLRIELPHSLSALGRWLRGLETGFTVSDALSRAPFAGADDAEAFLQALLSFGYLALDA